jgi:hypothetical protein
MAEDLGFEDELNSRINRDPFEPFEMIISSGDRFAIDGRVQVAVGRGTITLFHPRSGVTIIRKNQLVALRPYT